MDKFYQTADHFTDILPSTMARMGCFDDAILLHLSKKSEQTAQHIPESPSHAFIYYSNGIQFRPIAGCNEFPRTKQFLYTFNLPCGLNQNLFIRYSIKLKNKKGGNARQNEQILCKTIQCKTKIDL